MVGSRSCWLDPGKILKVMAQLKMLYSECTEGCMYGRANNTIQTSLLRPMFTVTQAWNT